MRVPLRQRLGKRGGRGGERGRGGGGRLGIRGRSNLLLKAYKHVGVYKAKNENGEKAYCTQNLVPGESVYNERRFYAQIEDGEEVEYRVWNPCKSPLAAVISVKVDNIYMAPGSKVLYLGAASGITVSHVSDLVGPSGVVFAVESSRNSYADLFFMSKKRKNLIPINADARYPAEYAKKLEDKYEKKLVDKYMKMLNSKVDFIYCDVTQRDQVEILASNASRFLKVGGHFLMLTKAVCIDPRATVVIDSWRSIPPDIVFSSKTMKLEENNLKPIEQVTLKPFLEGHACVFGRYLGGRNKIKH